MPVQLNAFSMRSHAAWLRVASLGLTLGLVRWLENLAKILSMFSIKLTKAKKVKVFAKGHVGTSKMKKCLNVLRFRTFKHVHCFFSV